MFSMDGIETKAVGATTYSLIKTGDTLELLAAMDAAGVQYVSWKNNHELSLSLNGHNDLDIFVPLHHRTSFICCAARLRWVQVVNPIAKHPWTGHFYCLDNDLRPCHIHVYFKIITGESWIKEYILPLEHLMITARTRDTVHNIWVLNDRTQAYLIAIRHLLKAGSFSSRFLYSRQLESYRNEWLKCGQTIETVSDLDSIRFNDFFQDSGLTNFDFKLASMHTAIKFRIYMSPSLRLAWWSLPLRRIYNFFGRALNKFILKRKKLFTNGGLVLVVAGVDGSGKTTMLAEIDRVLSTFLTVRRYSLGRPQHRITGIIARRMLRRSRSGNDGFKGEEISECKSTVSVIASTILSLLRLRMAKRALKTAMKGQVALVDRWPTDKIGMMDGPRIGLDTKDSILIRLCSHIEKWAYQRMPKADVVFFLDVPLDQLIERNRIRVKANKESDEEISDRHKVNAKFLPLTSRLVNFDNNGPFDQKRKELLLAIWKEVSDIC